MKDWIHKKGSKGQEVRRLQRTLGGLVVDGSYGPITETAVKDFQSANNLVVSGQVGNLERQVLEIEIFAGIDISKWQQNIDWEALKNSTYAKFCWIKATEGNNYSCPMFTKHSKDASSANILYGAYHFARPDLHKDPFKEVKNFVKHSPIDSGLLRPVLDFEKAGTHQPDSIRNWVTTFLKEFESQSGVRPIVYTGGNMVKYHLDSDTSGIDNYVLWHAYYSKKALRKGIKPFRLGGWKEWRVWQWTGSGTIDGYTGDIDRNWLVGGKEGLREIII